MPSGLLTEPSRVLVRALAFDLDRTIDRLVTSRIWGFPLMLLLLTGVFWITISGANLPSGLLAGLLLDTVHPFLKGVAAAISLPWWLGLVA